MSDWAAILGDRRAWVRDISLTAALCLFYSLLAPFGQNQIPLLERVVVNFALGFANMALLWPPMRLLLRFGDRTGLPELFVLAAGLVVLTVPVSLVSLAVIGLMRPLGAVNIVAVYFMILTMVLPGGVAYMMIERRLLTRPQVAPAPGRSAPGAAELSAPKLLERMSPRLGGEVLALQGEDHYVRVHTAVGSELLLMRLGDAVKDLEGLAGDRVHRSWWVAKDAVDRIRSSGRRMSLTLTNGLDVPVSREAASRLRRAGWLAG
jgi:hypothetical protein